MRNPQRQGELHDIVGEKLGIRIVVHDVDDDVSASDAMGHAAAEAAAHPFMFWAGDLADFCFRIW